MKKNIFTSLIFSAALVVFTSATAQQTKQTTPTDQNSKVKKETTTVSPTGAGDTKPTLSDNQSNLTSKEYGVKINEWMKTNIGTDDQQGGRINVAASNLITKIRDIRNTTSDMETRKVQIHEAMQNYNAQLKSVLKPEQFEIYKSKKQELISTFKEMKDESATGTE